jgi:hypothetical protein
MNSGKPIVFHVEKSLRMDLFKNFLKTKAARAIDKLMSIFHGKGYL